MDQLPNVFYQIALEDFHAARARGAVEELVARLAGVPTGLLPYDKVRHHFVAVESAGRILKEIPLDGIIGTVNRHNDFTRKLMPLRKEDEARWANVKLLMENFAGLPPIEVYQVGDAYFIIDGHHRASVARDLGATQIEAYVRQVYTRVPLSSQDKLEDIILKAEFAHFLTQTQLDQSRPASDFRATIPGAYAKLLDTITAHQYGRSQQEKREVSLAEAAVDWYDRLYLPVIQLIQTRNILRYFSDRTETDLYLWITEYRWRSEQELGWKITPRDAAENLTFNYARDMGHRLSRWQKKIVQWIMPAPFEPAVPPGFWRQQRKNPDVNPVSLFDAILVALPGSDAAWKALDAALFIAGNERAAISGLKVVARERDKESDLIQHIQQRFNASCQQAGVEGRMAVEAGKVPTVIYERSFWVDLAVIPLIHPPPFNRWQRLSSGIRTLIRRSATPLLLVPPNAPTAIRSALVAYGGGRLADEALAMAAYLCLRFTIDLAVIAIGSQENDVRGLLQRARTYLAGMGIHIVTYIEGYGDASRQILQHSQNLERDVILMGGYEGGLIREIIGGSTVDRVLRKTDRMVMICR